jgi:hypothetical protein
MLLNAYFCKIIVISTKFFLLHGMTRAAALKYHFLAAISPFNIINRIALAIGLAIFYRLPPFFNQIFSWDFPMDDLLPLLANAEHIPRKA